MDLDRFRRHRTLAASNKLLVALARFRDFLNWRAFSFIKAEYRCKMQTDPIGGQSNREKIASRHIREWNAKPFTSFSIFINASIIIGCSNQFSFLFKHIQIYDFFFFSKSNWRWKQITHKRYDKKNTEKELRKP